jgi:uncharacterized protein with GYD domain
MYILLVSWTDQGIREIKNSPDRVDRFKRLWSEAGGEVKAFYMTMGSHDMVVIGEAPDDETVASIVLRTGMGGAVRTTTLKAFSEADYRRIVGSLT